MQESFVLSVNDAFAKLLSTLALQYGKMASNVWVEQSEQQSILEASHSMVHAFKLFTQCIGHDLRTPIQALIFSNLKATRIVQKMSAHAPRPMPHAPRPTPHAPCTCRMPHVLHAHARAQVVAA